MYFLKSMKIQFEWETISAFFAVATLHLMKLNSKYTIVYDIELRKSVL